MRKNKNWQTSCLVCAAPVVNCGSGRPKGFCSDTCKVTRRKERQSRYQSRKRAKRKADRLAKRGRHIALRAPSKMAQDMSRQRNIIAAEKLKRAKCAYHLHYFGADLYVTQDLLQIFEFDHVDRTQKHQPRKKRGGGVARMVARVSDTELIEEMQKCELVCCNCHRLKTIQEKDYSNGPVTESHQIQLELN